MEAIANIEFHKTLLFANVNWLSISSIAAQDRANWDALSECRTNMDWLEILKGLILISQRISNSFIH